MIIEGRKVNFILRRDEQKQFRCDYEAVARKQQFNAARAILPPSAIQEEIGLKTTLFMLFV